MNIRPPSGAWARPRSVLAVLVTLLACHEEGPHLPDVSWSSEDFDFATDFDPEKLCGGSLQFQQQFVDLAQNVIGEPSERRKFTFYLFNAKTAYELLPDRFGLYNDGNVYAEAVPDNHEVTHAIVDLSFGTSHPFFNEGIAEVFRDRSAYDHAPVAMGVLAGLEYDGVEEKLPGSLYGSAGHFMSYLVEVHGLEAAVALLERARPGDPPELLQEIIASELGTPHLDLLADYADYPSCTHHTFRWPITECAHGAPIDAADGKWTIDADLDCRRDDVLGTRVGEVWTARTLEIPEVGTYRLSVSGSDEDSAFVELGHCSPGCAPDKGLVVRAGETRDLTLRAGRYYLNSVAIRVESGHLLTRIEATEAAP